MNFSSAPDLLSCSHHLSIRDCPCQKHHLPVGSSTFCLSQRHLSLITPLWLNCAKTLGLLRQTMRFIQEHCLRLSLPSEGWLSLSSSRHPYTPTTPCNSQASIGFALSLTSKSTVTARRTRVKVAWCRRIALSGACAWRQAATLTVSLTAV